MMEDPPERLPLPSEDGGDLVNEPPTGDTEDFLVATEEGVPYVPPTERVISEVRTSEGGADVAGTAGSDAGELEREDGIQAEDGALPRDDELQADVIAALRSSDVIAGDRIRIAVVGSVAHVSGEVESVDILDEVLGIVGDVVGVDDVVDEITVTGL